MHAFGGFHSSFWLEKNLQRVEPDINAPINLFGGSSPIQIIKEGAAIPRRCLNTSPALHDSSQFPRHILAINSRHERGQSFGLSD